MLKNRTTHSEEFIRRAFIRRDPFADQGNIPAVGSNALLGAHFHAFDPSNSVHPIVKQQFEKRPCGDGRLGCPGRAKLAGFFESAGRTYAPLTTSTIRNGGNVCNKSNPPREAAAPADWNTAT